MVAGEPLASSHEAVLTTLHVAGTLTVLIVVCAVAAFKQRQHVPAATPIAVANAAADWSVHEFARFQRSFLSVYLLCTFSDWLKGPYVYALYEEYGFSKLEIAWLFGGGFLSSLVFGTFVGSLSDKYGRKRMCLVFCGVYAASAITKVVNSFAILLLGRVLSGIATSLLFTTFESWLVTEHRSRRFPDHLLTNTFSKMILGNGAVAIFAGVVAQGAASCCGYVAPFLVAIPCLTVAAILMRHWNENYGDPDVRVLETLSRGWDAIRREKKLWYLGSSQALFEACMYVWVFYWTPSLRVGRGDSDSDIPFGLVFACYMCALMVGGTLTDFFSTEGIVMVMHCGSILSCACAALLFSDKRIVFFMFTVFEGLVGIYFAGHGTLRSLHIEEATRASVMNIFRVPLNLLVVAILQLPLTPRYALLLITVGHVVSLGCLQRFLSMISGRSQSSKA